MTRPAADRTPVDERDSAARVGAPSLEQKVRVVTARVQGAAQGRGRSAGAHGETVKHFVANDSERQRRMTLDARVGERALRELYMVDRAGPVFEHWDAAAGHWTVEAGTLGLTAGPSSTDPASNPPAAEA